ncbi:hypothetical protein [Parapedobacter sp.]
MEEAREIVEDLHVKIQHYKDTVSCTASQQAMGVEVVHGLGSDEPEYILRL